ncbi:hypothetical protein [Lentzea sp. NPDC051838]|uniref:hypothetical protein n=1 Tax=Lentzea sp. NPDC051838 TaxID=3154849 RepID=UPI00341CA291
MRAPGLATGGIGGDTSGDEVDLWRPRVFPTLRTGAKLVAFFALMFFAALRPEEASNLRLYNLRLPPKVWNEEAQRWEVHEWGVIDLEGAAPEVGAEWTDSGKRHEERELKHRHRGFGRSVPMCPELALYLYEHIDMFGIGPRAAVRR